MCHAASVQCIDHSQKAEQGHKIYRLAETCCLFRFENCCSPLQSSRVEMPLLAAHHRRIGTAHGWTHVAQRLVESGAGGLHGVAVESKLGYGAP